MLLKSKSFTMNKLIVIAVASIGLLMFNSCAKEEGPGGKATITGKLKVLNYNSTFTTLLDEYYAPGKNVYIMYGDHTFADDNVDTGPDGTFTFEFLREGKYTIYAVSKDKNDPTFTGTISMQTTVEITDKKQVLDIGDLVVYD